MRGMSQPTMGRSQSGMRRNGRPPAASSTLARKPFTAPRRCPPAERRDPQFVAQQRDQFFAALVAHQQPLLALPGHIAHGDVRQHVGVIDAGAARQRKKVRRQFRDRQLQKRNQFRAPVMEAQLDVIVGAEFQIGNGFGSSASKARNSWKRSVVVLSEQGVPMT